MQSAIIYVCEKSRSTHAAWEFYGIKRTTMQHQIEKMVETFTPEQYMDIYSHDTSKEMEERTQMKYSSKYTAKQVFTNEEETIKRIYKKNVQP